MPPALLQRANEILKQLEEKNVDDSIGQQVGKMTSPKVQLSIFDMHTETFQEIRQLVDNVDINRLTPVEALLKLREVKNLLK